MNKNKRLIVAFLVLVLSIARCQVSVQPISSSISGEQLELVSIAVSQLPYKLEYSNLEVINTAEAVSLSLDLKMVKYQRSI
jgi:hypothetical protein